MLGSKIHSRPLFVTGYIREQQVNHILIDGGSTVNILPLKILKELGISLDELHSIAQGGQRAIAKIGFHIIIGEMESSALFHVIDAKTTYKLLIGRPWLHEYGVVPSTYHQSLKYFQDGQVKKIVVDDKPFTVVEIHFTEENFTWKMIRQKKHKLLLHHLAKKKSPTPKLQGLTLQLRRRKPRKPRIL